MLANSKNELIIAHMDAIANILGGWKTQLTEKSKISTHKTFCMYEYKAHAAAITMCNGSYPGIALYSFDNTDLNVKHAEKKIKEYEDRIRYLLKFLFNDEDKINEKFFINTDPRGYALKLNLTPEESAYNNIAVDWGHYGILAAEPKWRRVVNEDGTSTQKWYFE